MKVDDKALREAARASFAVTKGITHGDIDLLMPDLQAMQTEIVRAAILAYEAAKPTPSPAEVSEGLGGERLHAVSDNGKRWRIVPEDGDWEMVPVGHISAGRAEAICKRIAAALAASPAPARVEAEPVAWRVRERPGFPWELWSGDPSRHPKNAGFEIQPLFAAPPRPADTGDAVAEAYEECAMIADNRAHISSELAYMNACREIASSIRARASGDRR